tara:strand:+ start:3506 stop:3856 length:351 start_codon:yes stop_codon:yes gene_type:complete
MSWNYTQEEYAEFIRIWNSSTSSCGALERLKVSPRFDLRLSERPRYGVVLVDRRDERDPIPSVAAERSHIQGVACALRRRGVSLKRLAMEDANRAKPLAQDRHLDFQELRSLSNGA